MRDTLEVLRSSGCTAESASAFQRTVERYSSTSFDFDFGKFPKPQGDFYSFDSVSGLVAALPHPLSQTDHAYEFNCFDTVITLAGHHLRTNIKPDDTAGPFLVPYTPTNGSFTILPRATARDAFTLAYPLWYREATDTALPKAMRDPRISLTAVLFRCHILPQSVSEPTLRNEVMDALRNSWRQQGMKFPAKFEVVLCHEVNLPQRWFVTAHAGLLIPSKHGYTCLEKSGGTGPFVRLDFDERTELLTWLGPIFQGAERLGYTHHFTTFNQARIETLEAPKN